MYSLLTGKAPLSEMTDFGSVLKAAAAGRIPGPRVLSRSVPRTLEAICLKAMALRPDDRYASATALAEDLERWLGGEPVRGVREGLGRRLTRWEHRNRLLIRIGGLALLTLAAVTGAATMLVNAAREQAELRRVEAEKQQQKADSERAASQSLAARLAIDRGLRLCEENVSHEGLLWMIRSLELSTRDGPLQNVARYNLDAWLPVVHQLRAVLKHDGPVLTVAVSPDGRWILTASEDGTARLWDRATGTLRTPVLRHDAAVRVAVFSPDGRRLLTAAADGRVRAWEAETGKPVFEEALSGPIRALALSPDGQTFAVAASGRSAQFRETATGQPWGEPFATDETILSLQFLPDGRLASGSVDTLLRLWEPQTREAIRTPIEQPGPVETLAVTADGILLASSGADNTARLWNTASLSADGDPLAHPAAVNDLSFLPDRHSLVTGCLDGAARIWDLATTSAPVPPLPFPAPLRTPLVFRPDGKVLAACSVDGTFCLYDMERGQLRVQSRKHDQAVLVLTVTPDGRNFVTAGDDGRIHVWDSETGQLRFDSPNVSALNANGPVRKAVVSPDGRRLVAATLRSSLQVWDLVTGKSLGGPWTLEARATSLAYSPDGRVLVLGLATGRVLLWDPVDGRPLAASAWHKDAIRDLVFSPDGLILASASTDNSGRLWHPETLEPLGAPLKHPAYVWMVRFSPDGSTLLTACFDGTARLWDVTTSQPRGEPLRHGNMVQMAIFSPDGAVVASAGRDGTARLWDAKTGLQIGPSFRHGQAVSSIAFQPGQRILASAAADRAVRFWRVPQVATGTIRELRQRVQRLSGLELRPDNSVRPLSSDAWFELEATLVPAP